MEDLLFKGHFGNQIIKNATIVKKDSHFEVTFISTSEEFEGLRKFFTANKLPPSKLDCSLGNCVLSLVEAHQHYSGKSCCVFIDLS